MKIFAVALSLRSLLFYFILLVFSSLLCCVACAVLPLLSFVDNVSHALDLLVYCLLACFMYLLPSAQCMLSFECLLLQMRLDDNVEGKQELVVPGEATVQAVFNLTGLEKRHVAGCLVTRGNVTKDRTIRVWRGNQLVLKKGG